MILKEEHVLFNFHYHSHPRDYKVSEQENIDPSWKDIDFSRSIKELYKYDNDIEFKIYLNGNFKSY